MTPVKPDVRIDVDELRQLKTWMRNQHLELLGITRELGDLRRQLTAELLGRTVFSSDTEPGLAPRRAAMAGQAVQLLEGVGKDLIFQVGPQCSTLIKAVDGQLEALRNANRPREPRGPLDPQLSSLKGLLWASGLGIVTHLFGMWLAGKVGYQGPAYARQLTASKGGLPAQPGIADLLKRVNTLKKDQVEVITVPNAQGVPRYIVLIRGITGISGGVNSLVDAIRGAKFGSSAHSAGVLGAMKAAKVPRGSEVMLVGHSQGGITAYNLAADAKVNNLKGKGGYVKITHVVTAGSPTARKDIPSQTQALSMEHNGDVVPDVDGDNARSKPGQHLHHFGNMGTPDVAGAHGLKSSYIPEAQQERFADSPGVRDFVSSAQDYLNDQSLSPERFELERGIAPEQTPALPSSVWPGKPGVGPVIPIPLSPGRLEVVPASARR
ncbi:MAG: hypothetical protein ACRDPW_04920 [Mycobacteriales bacterium]